jgi:hypothetical protein
LILDRIIPGMEFMDGTYVMRVTSVSDTEVHAKQKYEVLNDSTTRIVTVPGVVVYTDIGSVYERIKQMLE